MAVCLQPRVAPHLFTLIYVVPVQSIPWTQVYFSVLKICLCILSLAFPLQPPRSPNSLAQSSYSWRPCLLTLGLIFVKLASKSSNCIGLISSMVMWRSFSPRLRRGPIAASLASAVISDPENPAAIGSQSLETSNTYSHSADSLPSVNSTSLFSSSSEMLCFWWLRSV